MPKVHAIQTNFTRGEIDSQLEGRLDIDAYSNAVKTMENLFCLPQGGAKRRGGWHYVDDTKDHDKVSRLFPFIYSSSLAYILEFGDQYIRFYKDGYQIKFSVGFETILNGTFTYDIGYWTDKSAGGGALAYAAGKLQLQPGAGNAHAEQAITCINGEKYTLTFDVFSNSIKLLIGTTTGGGEIVNDDVKAVGSHVVTFTASAGTIYIGFNRDAAGNAEIDNASCTRGEELVTNPTFNTDIANWVNKSIGTGSIAYSAGTLAISGGAGGVGWAEGAVLTTVVGEEYCLSLDEVIDYPIQVRIGTSAGGEEIVADTVVAVGIDKKVTFTATTTTTYIGFRNTNNNTAKLDNVFCRLWEPYELATSYLEADLALIKVCQYTDSLYIVHPDYPPALLICSSDIKWTIEDIVFIDGPYFDEEETPTITPSATTGSVTLTASTPLFVPEHAGALWRIFDNDVWGYVIITAFTDSTHVTAEVQVDLGDTTASDAQREGMWSDYRGYPSTVSFSEDRVVFGGSAHAPQTCCGSKVGDYEDMTPGVEDDDAYVYTVASKQKNEIRWIENTDVMLIGTMGDEFKAFGGGDNPITPTNITVKSIGTYGSANIEPIRIGNSILFIQRAGRKLRELAFNWEEDSFSAQNISILAEHLTEGGLGKLAYQQEPHSIVWVIRADGLLLGLTFEKLHKVIGWHHHPTDGEVESIAVIPNATSNRDELWGIIKRTVESETRRYVEFIDPTINTDSALTGSFDSAVSSVSGLDHLIGETVDIVGNGAVYPQKVVDANGAVALDGVDASEVEVGLHYESTLLTLRPEVPISGTSQGIPKHWARVFVRLFESLGCDIGGYEIPFRKSTDLTGTAVPAFTGDVSTSQLGWDRDARIQIKQTNPLPMNVICLFGTLELGD